MAVLGALSVTLMVPELEPGVKFYTDAGLKSSTESGTARFRCEGHNRDSIVLMGGSERKLLHHISLRADDLPGVSSQVRAAGGEVVENPGHFADDGVWIKDPHGMLIHLSECEEDPQLDVAPRFEVNAPGRLVRKRRSAMQPSAAYPPAKPLRLGHILVFSPDVPASVRFMTDALGMALADRAQDIIAFCCARTNSDHHIVAFAKSAAVGFHHASFQVADPDEVGRGGRALVAKAGRGEWGFGRHTIGSNFFHYIQDPWGSWFEYYSDMDYIDDYSKWTPTNYAMEDSLANWGPPVPHDFVHNYEVGSG
jgi:catechol 2,3-dioxygenase-like lactoylglutathione lyase family enzyme